MFVFIFSAGAGLMSIGLMKLFPTQVLVENGLDPVVASGIAGTAMAVFFSLANGIGRIAWGTLSDKLGRRVSIVVMCATQGVFVIAFTALAGNEYLLYLGATLIGFNFKGHRIPAIFLSIENDLIFACDPLDAREYMINLPGIDIYGPKDDHIVRASQEPVMPWKNGSAGAHPGHNPCQIPGSIAN